MFPHVVWIICTNPPAPRKPGQEAAPVVIAPPRKGTGWFHRSSAKAWKEQATYPTPDRFSVLEAIVMDKADFDAAMRATHGPRQAFPLPPQSVWILADKDAQGRARYPEAGETPFYLTEAEARQDHESMQDKHLFLVEEVVVMGRRHYDACHGPLGIYRVEYFSSIDWKTIEQEVIAESEAQVRAWVDGNCSPSCRDKPYRGGDQEDSLVVERIGNATLPFIINP